VGAVKYSISRTLCRRDLWADAASNVPAPLVSPFAPRPISPAPRFVFAPFGGGLFHEPQPRALRGAAGDPVLMAFHSAAPRCISYLAPDKSDLLQSPNLLHLVIAMLVGPKGQRSMKWRVPRVGSGTRCAASSREP